MGASPALGMLTGVVVWAEEHRLCSQLGDMGSSLAQPVPNPDMILPSLSLSFLILKLGIPAFFFFLNIAVIRDIHNLPLLLVS